MLDGFVERYFGQAAEQAPGVDDAPRYGEAVAGACISGRSSFTTWMALLTVLGGTQATLNDDDSLSVGDFTDTAGAPIRWRAIAPWLWQEPGGDALLGARLDDGKVTALATAGMAPIAVYLPPPAALNGAWILPVLLVSLAILTLTALSWPLRALMRARPGRPRSGGRAPPGSGAGPASALGCCWQSPSDGLR